MADTEYTRKLRRIIGDKSLLEIGRKAIEDTLIEWRDARLSEPFRGNGLVVREANGEPSDIIRFGPEMALSIGLGAIADHLAALPSASLGEQRESPELNALQERYGFVLAACRDAQGLASRYAWALREIADMDSAGQRADDLGRAARTAREALLGQGAASPASKGAGGVEPTGTGGIKGIAK